MQTADPLAQLHDIVLPQAVSWWPLAWGWWLLLALIICLVACAIFFRQRNQQRQRYRLLAQDELNQIFNSYQEDKDAARYLQQLSILLRRCAISAQPKSFPVAVKGEAWLLWLDSQWGNKQSAATRKGFSAGPGRALLTGPYEAKSEIDITALHALATLWVQEHRNQWQKNRAAANKRAAATEVKQHA